MENNKANKKESEMKENGEVENENEYEEENEEYEDEEEEFEEDDQDIIDFEDFDKNLLRSSPRKSPKRSPKRSPSRSKKQNPDRKSPKRSPKKNIKDSPEGISCSPEKEHFKIELTIEEEGNYEDNVVKTVYDDVKMDDMENQEQDLLKKLLINKNVEKKGTKKNPSKSPNNGKKILIDNNDMDNITNTVDKSENIRNTSVSVDKKMAHNQQNSRISAHMNKNNTNKNCSITKVIENSNILQEVKSEGTFPDMKFSDLLDIDVRSLDREEIVQILMSNDYLKQSAKRGDKFTKPLKKKRYSQDHLNKLAYIKRYSVDTKNIDFLDNFRDPEYTNDFKCAKEKVK